MSSHLLLPSLFFFFFPLTRPHEAEEWQPLSISAAVSAVLACFGGRSAVSVPVSTRIGVNLAESVRIAVNKKKKEIKRGESVRRTPRWTPVRRPWSRVGAF